MIQPAPVWISAQRSAVGKRGTRRERTDEAWLGDVADDEADHGPGCHDDKDLRHDGEAADESWFDRGDRKSVV